MPYSHWFLALSIACSAQFMSCMEETALLEVTSTTYCALCNEEVETNESATLECGHVYHTICSADKECTTCFEDEYISYHHSHPLQSIQQEELPQRRKRPEWCKSVFGLRR